MLTFLRRLSVGFIYGVGFALGIAGVLALAVVGGAGYFTSTEHAVTFPTAKEQRAAPDQFAISDTSAIKTEWGSLNVLGTIRNTGEDSPKYVNVYADLYDKNGKFIFQCMHQFNAGLRKGQKENFMIECHGMPKELVANYERYEVHAQAFQ